MDLLITYDKSGSITEILNGPVTETYSYDELDRLTGTTGPWGTISYVYDSVGNRLSKSVTGGSTTSYTYDNVNRIASATGMSYDWDDNGNMLYWNDGSDSWNYTFDKNNQLLKALKNGSPVGRYVYDAGGRRVSTWDSTDGTTDYVYSGLNIIDEINSASHKKLYYANGLHLASNSSDTVEYYHPDHIGSTRLKTNSTGDVIYESNYEPFGPDYGESGEETYRYTGKPEDNTGLYYYGARYYDPFTGRFITRDTVFGDLKNPKTQNQFVYCTNNPHKYFDPDGRLQMAFTFGLSRAGKELLEYEFSRDPNMNQEYYEWERNRLVLKEFSRGFIEGLGYDIVIWSASTGNVPAIGAAITATQLIFTPASNIVSSGIAQAYDTLVDAPTSHEVHEIEIINESASIFTTPFDKLKQHYVDPRLMMDPFLKIEADKYWNDLKKTIISAWTEEYITDSSWDEREQSREIP